MKHDYRWKGDELEVLILAMRVHNITRKSKDKTTNRAKALHSSRQTEKQPNKKNLGWAMHYTRYLCSPAKRQTEWNKNNPKPKIKQEEGSWGTLGNAELWEKCSSREKQNGEKYFTQERLFSD